jgi:raffinose/stachyose/melibiose transport system permease protein
MAISTPVESAPAAEPASRRGQRRRRRTSTPTAHIYSAKAGARPVRGFLQFAAIPTFAFVVVVLVPFLVGVVLTFTSWNGIDRVTSLDYEFTGVTNYSDAVGDEDFQATMWHTAWYVVAVVVLANASAFGLALLVTAKLRARNFFRALFFTPNLIGGVILGFIWVFVFNQMLPWAGDTLGIGMIRTSWLTDPHKALWTMIIVAVWQLSGYLMLIYIAGLVSIPNDVIEASVVDGASSWKQLRYVKIPLMVPAFTISVFLALRNAFLVFDVNLALTGGGPFRSTELITLNVYLEAFRFQRFETAQAKAVLLYLVIAAVAAVQVSATRRHEVTE